MPPVVVGSRHCLLSQLQDHNLESEILGIQETSGLRMTMGRVLAFCKFDKLKKVKVIPI